MSEWNPFWNLIYPRHCPVCHKILKKQSWSVCPECRYRWKPIQEPRCFCCGKPLELEEEEYCRDCRSHPHAFERGIGIFAYDAEKKNSLLKYKYGGRREYATYYGEACIAYGREKIVSWNPDGIIPIPLHPHKERMRGFNQSAELAEYMGKQLQLPVYENCLRKKNTVKEQKTLDAAGRRKNQEMFLGTEGIWDLETILLVDDVYTTGSTLDAAARELLRHGVKRIYFLTIFIGKGF